MRFLTSLLLLSSFTILSQNQKKYNTYFEKGNGNQSATYQETIAYFQLLANDFETIGMKTMGLTDSGEPLHLVTFNSDATFDFEAIQKKKAVLLINNGIHAGEPDGIDASMQFFRDLALGKIKAPKNTVIVCIPVYNIGGALNRNNSTRANQKGPEEYGFRGNARNFDLNRDFIKSDTRNTKSFVEIFHLTNPDVFIDNHVSNGSDYQYKLTYIMTEPSKLGTVLGSYLRKEMMPSLVKDLQKKKIETTPYVNTFHETPDQGFAQFFDSPRYTTGYTSLFNSIGFVVETHMLKKYADRVKVTYEFMKSTLEFTDANASAIKQKRKENEVQFQPNQTYTLQWEVDNSVQEPFTFLGYEASYKKSEATTGQRLYYDRTKPFKKEVPFFPQYKTVKDIIIPKAYVIPRGYWPVIDLLKSNGIVCQSIQKDTIIEVESYRIVDYKTPTTAYEGHYNHRNTVVKTTTKKIAFAKGDYIISSQQKGIKYILETLEPTAVDSYFNWNFFDPILQQKEGYSDYVFEDTAAQLLNENPKLKSDLEIKKQTEPDFLNNPKAQLDWIYKQSNFYEKAHLAYPVYRIIN